MDKISSILPKVLSNYNLGNESQASHILYIFIDYCESLFGDKCMKNIQAKRYQKGIIYVTTKNAVWAQQLQLIKIDIIRKLNTVLHNNIIKEIKITIAAF